MILGCSYGLLGPSGCGKTTLLKCIVGTLKISRGHIIVLGKPPAFPGHDVPGKMVGYMPQVSTTCCTSLTILKGKSTSISCIYSCNQVCICDKILIHLSTSDLELGLFSSTVLYNTMQFILHCIIQQLATQNKGNTFLLSPLLKLKYHYR